MVIHSKRCLSECFLWLVIILSGRFKMNLYFDNEIYADEYFIQYFYSNMKELQYYNEVFGRRQQLK